MSVSFGYNEIELPIKLWQKYCTIHFPENVFHMKHESIAIFLYIKIYRSIYLGRALKKVRDLCQMISFSRFTIGKNWINICVLFYKLMTDNIYPKLQIFSFREIPNVQSNQKRWSVFRPRIVRRKPFKIHFSTTQY